MTPEQMIKNEIERRGMTMQAVCRRAGVKYSSLQPSMKGRRELRADEYISICILLGIDPRSYQNGNEKGA